MSRPRIVIALAGAAAVWCAAPAVVTHAAQARTGSAAWGNAIEVPGLGTLNAGGSAQVVSVSCASAGNCAAGGSYQGRSGHVQAFVASERLGHWAKAIEVPGTATLNTGENAAVNSVSCASPGNCTAGGFYTNHRAHVNHTIQAFVVSERDGRWGTAIKMPGTATLNTGGDAVVTSVSCASAGNCTAGGFYYDRRRGQAFVASERNGRWSKAIEVPGTAALNVGRSAVVDSVSCASAGNCAAAGSYTGPLGRTQAFVASQRNGRWANAIEVPGTAALNGGGFAQALSVSCASAGNCAVGGTYTARSLLMQAFVASQRNGRWRTAIKVPGTVAVNTGGNAQVISVSCASAGNCTAGGFYAGRHRGQAFVASQRNGRWRRAIEVPGTAALNTGGNAEVLSVSCASAGNCTAGGFYRDGSRHFQAFVVSERNGRWGKAIEVPGTATLNRGGNAQVSSVSCSSAANCAAGGSYTDRNGNSQGFVVSRS